MCVGYIHVMAVSKTEYCKVVMETFFNIQVLLTPYDTEPWQTVPGINASIVK